MRQAADLAHKKEEEKENQQQRPAADRQPDRQPDPYNDRNAGRARTGRTHKAILKGALLARPSIHSSDTHKRAHTHTHTTYARGCSVAGDQTEC